MAYKSLQVLPAAPSGSTEGIAINEITTGNANLIGRDLQVVQLSVGAEGEAYPATAANPVPVRDVGALTALKTSRQTINTAVPNTPTQIAASPLANRQSLLLRAASANTAPIYIVSSTAQEAPAGITLAPGESFPIALGAGGVLYAGVTVTGQVLEIMEMA